MSIQKKILFLGISWLIILGGVFLNRSFLQLTGFYYWPTFSLIAYLMILCSGLTENDFIVTLVLFLLLPLAFCLDLLWGAASFGYYGTGLLLGSLCLLSGIAFANIKTKLTQIIAALIFLICFWIIGPFLFTNFINQTQLVYNFIPALTHLAVDFSFCFIWIELRKNASTKNV